jgi:hypothetical protein
MEDSMSNKHLPRLFEQGLNDKRVELFDELIHPEYNSHNSYVEPGRRALSILSAPPRTKTHTGGGDNANFELRVLQAAHQRGARFYMEKIYPRHLNSFPLFGIVAHGF